MKSRLSQPSALKMEISIALRGVCLKAAPVYRQFRGKKEVCAIEAVLVCEGEVPVIMGQFPALPVLKIPSPEETGANGPQWCVRIRMDVWSTEDRKGAEDWCANAEGVSFSARGSIPFADWLCDLRSNGRRPADRAPFQVYEMVCLEAP